jgi:tetratricopeptide (TPR) repeat protein
VQEALAVALRFEHSPGVFGAQELLAWQEVREGEPKSALARLEPLLERLRVAGYPRYPTVYAWALIEVGDLERAEEALSGARRLAEASTSRGSLPEVLLQEARLAICQGRGDDAVRDLQEGLSIARESGLPYEEALLLEAEGRIYEGEGAPERVRERLEESLAIFRRLGASPDAERVEKWLTLLGESA